MARYDYFEHGADVGIIGRGASLEEAFEEGARAMFNLMVDIEGVRPIDQVSIDCQGSDVDGLFIEWLNHLLTQADIRQMVFSEFTVEEIKGFHLRGSARGEQLAPDRHLVKTEVKAATYSMLATGREGDEHFARCVVDV